MAEQLNIIVGKTAGLTKTLEEYRERINSKGSFNYSVEKGVIAE